MRRHKEIGHRIVLLELGAAKEMWGGKTGSRDSTRIRVGGVEGDQSLDAACQCFLNCERCLGKKASPMYVGTF